MPYTSLSRRAAVKILALEAAGVNKYSAYVPGSNCDNCLQLQGAPGND